MFPYQTLAFLYMQKIQKCQLKTINLKYQLRHGTKCFNKLMNHPQYLIFKITLNISLKIIKQLLGIPK